MSAFGEPWTYCGQRSDGHLSKSKDGDLGKVFSDAGERFCSCGFIWSMPHDYPVLKMTVGKWGDEYPAIRIPEQGAIGAVAEPYMEMIEYGEIPIEAAEAASKRIVTVINACAGLTDEEVVAMRELYDRERSKA